MKIPFLQLKRAWQLADDISLEELLEVAQNKQAKDKDNPELIFNIAEIQRHLGNTSEANSHYRNAIEATTQRTKKRGITLEERVRKSRNSTRAKLILFTLAPLILLLLVGTIAWKTLSEPEPLPKGSDPNKFAFTQWLAKQQMAQIITTLQQQNPELSFNFNSPVSSNQTPMEFMQSLMQADAIDKLKREKQASNQKDDGEDGSPSFQCSKERAVQCAAKDIPSAAGAKRQEVILLMEAYRAILNTERDCEKIEQSIQTIGDQLQWRKSERRIKADLEDFAVECFYRQKNVEKTIEHARKLQCAGDDGYINSVYWYMTAINHHAKDMAKAQTSYQCFQEATEYVESNDRFTPAYVASRHRESGALAWLYFNDLSTATKELEKARNYLKRISKKTPVMLEVAGEIDLDLLETYVTSNIDQETFDELLHDINSSGRLTDGYKQIKDTLVAIYYLQNKKSEPSLTALGNLVNRFKLMPEFICGWDWTGFKRGLDDSILDDEIRKQAINLVDLANCYTPSPMAERIQRTNKVAAWIRNNQ